MFSKITKKNWLFFAIKNYNVPNLDSEQEFYEDIKRFKYLKRLLKRYELTGDLQERLILNHIIVLYNVFGIEACNKMMWYKINEEHWHYLKPFLVYLNYLPEGEKVTITMDPYTIEVLREL